MIGRLLHNAWNHRFFISFALTETGAVRGARVRAFWLVFAGFFAVAGAAALVLIGDMGRARLAAAVSGSKELKAYVQQIAELEKNKAYQDKQLEVVAQELGILQARLDRFDVIGEKLITDESLSDIFEGDELATGAGGPIEQPEVEQNEIGPQSAVEQVINLEELKTTLRSLRQRADKTESALQAGLALALRNSEDQSVIPHLWPVMHVRAYKSSNFGWRKDPIRKTRSWHGGTDFAAGIGVPIVSAADGIVVFAGYRYKYGILVEVRHGNGFSTRYAHLKEAAVKNGDRVSGGALVGLMGNTGRSTGPHLHFEVLRDDKKIDPYPFVRESRQHVRRLAQQGRGKELLAQWEEKKRSQIAAR